MKTLNISVIALAFIAIIGCGSGGGSSSDDVTTGDTNKTTVKGTEVNYEVLALESGNYNEEQGGGKILKIVETQTEFEKTYALSSSHLVDTKMPNVDFTKNNVLAMFYGGPISGSYSISLKDLRTENNSTTTAYVDNNRTGGYCGTSTADESSPFSFVAYPKTNNELIFKESYKEVFVRDDSCAKEEIDPIDVNFTEILNIEYDYAKPEHTKHFEVIRSQKRYDTVYADTNTSYQKPSVDFEKEAIIYLGMGYFPSGGYSIEVTKITKTTDYVKVDVKTTYPGGGCPVGTAMTAPKIFVKIASEDSFTPSGGPVIFNETRVKQASCN